MCVRACVRACVRILVYGRGRVRAFCFLLTHRRMKYILQSFEITFVQFKR